MRNNNKVALAVLASALLLALPFAGSASAQINNGLIGNWTFDETAGFTSPEHNVTNVEIIATPAEGAMPGQVATAYSHTTTSCSP
ncbi:MAG: hypothetical protein EOO39_14870 [Cytophagaceae bacterium]|nr:MAG: hypothetical protein EOO39_14870 [Cytophagaceae bacterium]